MPRTLFLLPAVLVFALLSCDKTEPLIDAPLYVQVTGCIDWAAATDAPTTGTLMLRSGDAFITTMEVPISSNFSIEHFYLAELKKYPKGSPEVSGRLVTGKNSYIVRAVANNDSASHYTIDVTNAVQFGDGSRTETDAGGGDRK